MPWGPRISLPRRGERRSPTRRSPLPAKVPLSHLIWLPELHHPACHHPTSPTIYRFLVFLLGPRHPKVGGRLSRPEKSGTLSIPPGMICCIEYVLQSLWLCCGHSEEHSSTLFTLINSYSASTSSVSPPQGSLP